MEINGIAHIQLTVNDLERAIHLQDRQRLPLNRLPE
jgi:hypothetical protein